MITRDEYMKEWNKYQNILDGILKICGNEKIEGNCLLKDKRSGKGIFQYPKHLLSKRMNLYTLGQTAENILEIGFNAGHSCLHFLISNSKSKIVVADICSHDYTKKCFEYLQQQFPNRLEVLLEGSSQETVPKYLKNNHRTFDLIHVDGAHDAEFARQDLENVYKACTKYIVFDDTWLSHLNKVYHAFREKYNLKEVNHEYYDTSDTFSHGILFKTSNL